MIIAIPVDDQTLEDKVCISFGRAPYFLVYDTESGNKSIINNSGASSQGGAGIKAAQTVVDSGVGVVLTPRCGENAAEVIQAAGIKMYKTNGDSITENINAYKEGKLEILENIHPGFHGKGDQ